MNPFVGVKQVSSAGELRQLLDNLSESSIAQSVDDLPCHCERQPKAKRSVNKAIARSLEMHEGAHDPVFVQSPESSYYFLRWHHKISGIVTQIAEFPSPEGQMFNSQIELRWKQQGSGYEVLLLSRVEPSPALGFEAIGSSWEIIDRDAQLYEKTETRFPQGFDYDNFKIAQRYFMDAQTATVHFVALTVNNHD